MTSAMVVIPTLDRVGEQHTFHRLPPRWQERAVLACPPAEAQLHSEPTWPCPANGHHDPANGIHTARQWVMDNADADVVIMLDDDLGFRHRQPQPGGGFKLVQSTPEDVGRAMDWLAEACGERGYVQAGLGNSYMNQARAGDEAVAAQVIAAQAYNRRAFHALGLRFRLRYHEDVDVTLQLLTRGQPNVVSNVFNRVQPPGQGPGGCSTRRTVGKWNRAAIALYRNFPDFVAMRWRVLEGADVEAWGGVKKATPTIRWKAAYEHGKQQIGGPDAQA